MLLYWFLLCVCLNEYAISQLQIVRSGLHLVTYLDVGNFWDKRTEKTLHEFVCKVFLDFPIATSQTNLYRQFTNWLSLLESVNIRKTCSKLHVRLILWSKLPTYFDDVTTIEMTSRHSKTIGKCAWTWGDVSCDIPYYYMNGNFPPLRLA